MAFERPSAESLAAATPEQLAELAADCLSGLRAGRQPFSLFRELRRLVVMSTIELVPLRTSSSRTEVLLGQRPTGPEEPWWGGQLNLPGSVVLPDEPLESYQDYDNPSDRILDVEFNGSVIRTSGIHVFDHGFQTGVSGRENKTWAWTEVELAPGWEGPDQGDFYDVQNVIDRPPETLVDGHDVVLSRGYAAYKASRS